MLDSSKRSSLIVLPVRRLMVGVADMPNPTGEARRVRDLEEEMEEEEEDTREPE